MEALTWLLGLPSWREALDVAEKYYARETVRPECKVRAPTLAEVSIYERMLGDRIEWLFERGLSPEAIRSAGIGHNGAAFTIPSLKTFTALSTLPSQSQTSTSVSVCCLICFPLMAILKRSSHFFSRWYQSKMILK